MLFLNTKRQKHLKKQNTYRNINDIKMNMFLVEQNFQTFHLAICKIFLQG